jgi:hypothetical protein
MSKIVAIVATDKEQIAGGAPMFFVDSQEELMKLSFSLEKIMDANAHDLGNGLMIIVDHKSGG